MNNITLKEKINMYIRAFLLMFLKRDMYVAIAFAILGIGTLTIMYVTMPDKFKHIDDSFSVYDFIALFLVILLFAVFIVLIGYSIYSIVIEEYKKALRHLRIEHKERRFNYLKYRLLVFMENNIRSYVEYSEVRYPIYVSKEMYYTCCINAGYNFEIDENRKGAEIGLQLKTDVLNSVEKFFDYA